MATSRYISRTIFNNKNSLYQQKFLDKGTTNFVQYTSPTLSYPSAAEMQGLDIISHVWKQGDSFEKLAFSYYRDSNYWWVIATFNQKPTEQHFSVGDTVYIPLPIYEILTLLGY